MTDTSLTDQLCTASANGKLAQVKQCLQNGAQVNGHNVYGRTPLQVVKLGCPAVVAFLLGAGADPDRRDPLCGLTVAHDAARDGFGDTVRVLVDCGADVNLVDARGNLPLHLAAREGRAGVVALLMERTAQPELHNSQGRTAHDLALQGGHVATAQCIRYLR